MLVQILSLLEMLAIYLHGLFLANHYVLLILPNIATSHSNHVTSSKHADTLICHTTMCKNPIHFLYNSGHVTFWHVEEGLVANARQGSMQEHDRARVMDT